MWWMMLWSCKHWRQFLRMRSEEPWHVQLYWVMGCKTNRYSRSPWKVRFLNLHTCLFLPSGTSHHHPLHCSFWSPPPISIFYIHSFPYHLHYILPFLLLKGDGPLEGLFAVSNGKGELKGYVGSTRNIPPNMALSEAVGTTGTLQIVKNHPDWPNPYNGVTEIVHGDIDRDVGIYLARSEQRSCALAAATTVQGILCTSAGGYVTLYYIYIFIYIYSNSKYTYQKTYHFTEADGYVLLQCFLLLFSSFSIYDECNSN